MYFDIFESVIDLVLLKDDEATYTRRLRLIDDTMFPDEKFTYQQLFDSKYLNVVNDWDFIYEDVINDEGTFHSNSERLKKYIEDMACPIPMLVSSSKSPHDAGTSKTK